MKLFLFDIRELMSGMQYVLQPDDAGIGIHLKDDNQTVSTEPGIPEHRIIHSKRIVTFGVPRLLKQDQRNSSVAISSQVYNFISQNPQWYPNTVYRPVFDVSIDDALSLALMSKEHRKTLLLSGTKLMALLAELNEWTANRYSFVKNLTPRLLNYYLASLQYPFYDYPSKSRVELCETTLLDLMELIGKRFDEMEPIRRTYPDDLRFDVLYSNEKSALLRLKIEKYGVDDLVAQQYFESNPSVVRIITTRRIKNTTKHVVIIHNSNMYNEKLEAYNYADTKELNSEEKNRGGEVEWKNLKITALGPRRGSVLSPELIWKHTAINV